MATAVVPSGGGEVAAPIPPAGEPIAKPEEPKPVKAKPIKDKVASELGLVTKKDAGKELFGGVKRNEKGQFARVFGKEVEDALGSFEENVGASEEEPDIHEGMPGEVAPQKPVVKAEGAAKVEGEPAPVAKPGEAAPEPPKPAFKFAGEDFPDQAAAEQKFKTLQGMFKPLNERAQAYDRLKAEQAEDRQAALEWSNVARQLLAGSMSEEDMGKLRGQLGVGGNVAPSPKAKVSPESIIQDLDLQMFEDLALHPNGGLKVAGEHLAEQILNVVNEKLLPSLKQEYQASLQPFVSDREMQSRAAALDSLLTQVGSYKLQDGTLAFPELNDPAAIDDLATVMVEFGRGPDDLTTPQGVMQAVALYRMAKGFRPATSPSGGSASQPGQTGVTPPPVPAPGAAASIGADNRGGGAPSDGRPRFSGPNAKLLESMSKVTAKPDRIFNEFGFHKNPRVVE